MAKTLSPTLTDADAEQAKDALAEVHTRTVDALAGFETMVDKAEPDFRPIAIELRELHEAHARRLAAMLVARGCTPDADGSFMSTVNRAVVAIRAWLGTVDDDVVDQVRSGEAHVIQAFDDAATHLDGTEDAVALRDMRGELDAALGKMAALDRG